MFELKSKLIIFRDKLLKKKNNDNNLDDIKKRFNIRNDIIDVKFEDNLIFINIKDECNFFDYSHTIDKCYNRLNQTFIPIKILITNGGNIYNWVLFKQKINIFRNNDCEYMISVSDKKVKISQTILRDKFYHETELEYKVNEREYTIYKLIHDLNRSTKCPKWYPEEENSNFYLDKEEAYELAKDLFDNLKKIKNIDNIINNIGEIESVVNNSFDIKKKVAKFQVETGIFAKKV